MPFSQGFLHSLLSSCHATAVVAGRDLYDTTAAVDAWLIIYDT